MATTNKHSQQPSEKKSQTILSGSGMQHKKTTGFSELKMNPPRMEFGSLQLAPEKANSERIRQELKKGTETKKQTFPVLQMSCASCAANIERILKSQAGVIDAAINFAAATVTVEFIPNLIQPAELKKAVQAGGYDMVIESSRPEQETLENIHQQKYTSLKKQTIGSLVLSVPIVIIGMFFMKLPYANQIMWVLSTPVLLWFGKDFYINAWKQATHRTANMDTLVALSTGVAYTFSVFNTLLPDFWLQRGMPAHVYFEAAAVIITFILLGRMLEEKAKGKTSEALKNLMGLQPKFVTKISKNGEQVKITIDEVKKGDIIAVKPGEKIAVDGRVIEGSSYVDESMLNGEPVAILKTKNEMVFAGTINQKGSFLFRAEKIGAETMLSQIIQMVKDAQGSKAPIQKLADKIAAVFVPVVIGIAMLTFIIWIAFGGANGFTYGLLAAITVLVIACPCALGLATPTAIMVGIGKGAGKGILIKDAQSLELAKKVNAVVLDKTGTVTEGKPTVTGIKWLNNDEYEKSVFLSIEKQSEHPLAEAVAKFLNHQSTVPLHNFESITGKGVRANANEKSWFVGNKQLLEENNICIEARLAETAKKWSNEAKSIIWFADSKNALAVVAASDKVKENSAEAIRRIRKAGIEIYMLTGDNENTAKTIAAKVGVNLYKAEALPGEKADFVKQLQQQGKVVAMVGDGINDGAALALADVSIAMGKGSDIAMDVANMTIISSDLNKIPEAIQLSKQTVKTIRQNLFWAFVYNIIGIPIAAGILFPFTGFLLNPMIAGAAMAMSSISVVSNSLRLKRKN
ncbi:Cu2+-exporting ATPase [Mariniphaga anaerophila]|uniref:Cu2+-exporting ATPase n=1 Tax=Mariniphaga anaerophila TaxID=1484053 RepID=A0A1M4XTD8_9BACT|nr:heavy metal translocating P-type ATPase [Mariniphaga anaerophila]SHE96705.1 Cu2+-exporting ATPase [Mariniphaga anaerophila]